MKLGKDGLDESRSMPMRNAEMKIVRVVQEVV